MKSIFDSIERRLQQAWGRVVASADENDSALAIVRVFFGLFVLLISTPSFGWIGTAPSAFYDPPLLSFAALFNGYPHPALLQIADLVFPLLFVGVALGIKARLCGFAAAVLYLVLSNFGYSFGKIDHIILSWVALLLLSFSNWGTRLALVPDRPCSRTRHQTALALLAICIAFGMVTAGLEKAYHWVDFDLSTNGFLHWFYGGFYSLDRRYLLAPYVLQVDPRLFEFADYTAVAFEMTGFIFLVLGPRWWRAWLLCACYFHIGNTLLLNLPFVTQVVVYSTFLIPIVVRAFRRQPNFPIAPGWSIKSLGVAATIFAVLHLYQRISTNTVTLFWLPPSEHSRQIGLYTALAIWLSFTALVTLALVREQKQRKVAAIAAAPNRQTDAIPSIPPGNL